MEEIAKEDALSFVNHKCGVCPEHNNSYDGADATVERIRMRSKWENDNYVCRSLILNGMSDSLFNIYQNVESGKEL
ncbi:hypothetical protein Tco_1289483 [Tanacetum coccineum]